MALEYYNKAIEKEAELTNEDKINIARCHYHLNDITTAFSSYVELESELKGEDVFYYASCWHQEGGFEIAISWYEKAKEEGANPLQVKELIKACNWALENQVMDPTVLVNPAGLLIGGQSFGIQYFKDAVVYSSESEGSSKNVDKQGSKFLNLFTSSMLDGEIQDDKKPFSKNLQFDYHVGATSFTSDYKTMYFTKSVRIRGGDSVITSYSIHYTKLYDENG